MSDHIAYCAECGARRHEGTAFCIECGTAFPVSMAADATQQSNVASEHVALAALPRSQPKPLRQEPQTRPPSRRVRTVGLGLLVALLFGATGVTGWWLLSRDDANDSSATSSGRSGSPEATKTDGVDGDPEAGESEGPTGGASPSPEPSTNLETCWNGEEAERATDCPPLQGVDGLRFVFPSMDASFNRCRENVPSEGKVRAWACTESLADGTTISIVYSEWQSHARMSEHYFAKFDDPPSKKGAMYVWGVSQRPMSYQSSGMFIATHPYSYSVVAQTFADAEEGLGLVVSRPLRDLPRGY